MKLFEQLLQANAPSGNEGCISDLIAGEIASHVDEVYTDNMGNLVAHIRGDGKRILVAAHMDEIGILVNFIDKNGFLRFAPLGGVMPHCALYQRVKFQNGVIGIVAHEEKNDVKKKLDFTTMYVDIGAASLEEAAELVSIGDSASFCGETVFTRSGKVISKALDNRAGVYALIRAIKSLKSTPNDLYFVFTVQEELGCRGAAVAANAIEPDIALCVDVTDTGDTPECNRMAVKLGKGPCIKYMDNSIITHKYVNDILRQVAQAEAIDVQHEVLNFGGTDAGAIHISGNGVMTGALSIPTRYIHTPGECVCMEDVEGCARLISGFVSKEM